MPKLLALDLSTSVGHAILERGRPPLFGTLRLVGTTHAARMSAFLAFLEDMQQLHSFDSMAWERPIITPRDTVDKLEILYGLVGIAYAWAGRMDVPYRECSVQQAKITLTGKGTAKKDEMIAAAMKIGWKVADDHQADAGAVGAWAFEQIWPKARAA